MQSQAEALLIDKPCSDIEAVYVRGSGQGLDAEEALRFRDQLSARVSAPLTVNFYELGTEAYGRSKYEAISMDKWWENGNAVGAKLSAGHGNDYGKSVSSGIQELQSYVTQRNSKCPNARIVIGGYSQGAQVVGQALSILPSSVQARIDFIALFGDPKLYLPEGEGTYPPACRGADLSLWRRTIGNCKADGGVLGARKPFLPETMISKVGLWCNSSDFICGTSKKVWDNEGHTQYKDIGGAIDQAIIEIAQRLKLTLTPAKALNINATKQTQGVGTTGMDVVFMLNSAGWSSQRLDKAKDFIRSAATKLKEQHSRVALGTYDGGLDWAGMGFPMWLQEDQTELFYVLNLIHTTPPTTTIKPTLSVIMDTYNQFRWKWGASKMIIVMSDHEMYNPDRYGMLTIAHVAKRSLEIDPVNIYPITPMFRSSFRDLANSTSGQVLSSDNDFSTTLAELNNKVLQRPTALLKNPEYLAEIGQKVTFDATDSYVVNGQIVKYEWDFNGDGTFERSTTAPHADFVYEQQFDGVMQVRVTASNNTLANASAKVKIGLGEQNPLPKAPLNLKATIVSTINTTSTIELNWENQPNSVPVESWAIGVNDIVIGTLPGDKRSVQITDIEQSSDVRLSVAGVTSEGVVGVSAEITLAKVTPPKTPSKHSIWSFVRLLLDYIYKLHKP